MSTLKVEVVAIDAIEKHPNADRLDLVKVKEWRVVAGRDPNKPSEPRYKAGDPCIYIPIDSVLSPKLEALLFPPDSKITLTKSRIKTIKLRGAISQGMIVDFSPELLEVFPKLSKAKVGDDVTDLLGVTKYEPPLSETPQGMRVSKNGKVFDNPHFHKYSDIENFKNHGNMFDESDPVYISEKLHGTSARFGILPAVPANIWDRVLKFFGFFPKYQFCYGSRNVQLQGRFIKKTFYGDDVYGKIAKRLSFETILRPGEVVYGEIVGEGIQAGYDYGFKNGSHGFFAYDVKIDGRYLAVDEFLKFCRERSIPTVPLLYFGPWNKTHADLLRSGASIVGGQKIREGIVIKDALERSSWAGRKVLKYVNDDYLLQKDLTDFH